MATPNQWFVPPTFHHQQFADALALRRQKQAQGLRISLCIPTLNEAATIGSLLHQVRVLRDEVGLVDEITVVDSGSIDGTRQVAAEAGADVYLAADILPQYGNNPGKGENLWKALYQLRGDLLLFLDGDVTTVHPGYVTGLIGPLLADAAIGYVKGCYDRPADTASETDNAEAVDAGGRLTEILARPLLSLWYPQLGWLIQPLAGEFCARRFLLERLAHPVGYGVELAHLLDLAQSHGPTIFAQTDLGRRCHRHRSNRQLGQAAYALLQVLQRRLRQRGILQDQSQEVPLLNQFARHAGQWQAEALSIIEQERPPLIDIPEYRARHHQTAENPLSTPQPQAEKE